MTDLIARLEKATGPDRVSDAFIHRAVNPQLADTVATFHGSDGWLVGGGHEEPTKAPAYTSSIDAALKLIPEGLYWAGGFGKCREDEPLGGAALFRPGNTHDPVAQAEAPSVALAICIAALKARAALKRNESGNVP